MSCVDSAPNLRIKLTRKKFCVLLGLLQSENLFIIKINWFQFCGQFMRIVRFKRNVLKTYECVSMKCPYLDLLGQQFNIFKTLIVVVRDI